MKTKKSWREKLENPPSDLPKVVEGSEKWKKRYGVSKVLIPTPLLIDKIIRKIPKKRLITVDQIRRKLAKDFNAEMTCPLTTGIFLRIVSEAAEEDSKNGKKQITPYWRVIKKDGKLIDKISGGIENHIKKLKNE